MDPITQGALGAAAAQALSKDEERLKSFGIGWLAGMAPDLDIFIKSSTNPLIETIYHRHFTHALSFIPMGALVVALVFWPFLRRKMSFGRLYFFCFVGFATHGFLDACTSYGTVLYWPFTDYRESFNVFSIIDPLITFSLLLGLGATLFTKKVRWVRMSLAFLAFYFCFAAVQNFRVINIHEDLARERGHSEISRQTAKPSLFNSFLWRAIYEHEGRYYADAIWALPFFEPRIYEGGSLPAFTEAMTQEIFDLQTQQAKDIEIYRWFADDYLTYHPDSSDILIDFRYSLLPNSVRPLWGIRIFRNKPERHVIRDNFRRDREKAFPIFKRMLRGQPLPTTESSDSN